jgi:hypothetical protein
MGTRHARSWPRFEVTAPFAARLTAFLLPPDEMGLSTMATVAVDLDPLSLLSRLGISARSASPPRRLRASLREGLPTGRAASSAE